MKAKIFIPTLMALCAAGSLWSGSALADEVVLPKTEVSVKANPWMASQVMNAPVKDLQGNTLGQIKDVIIDPATGRATFAIIQLNGDAGPRDSYAPVPFALIKPSTTTEEPKTFVLNADKKQFAASDKFYLKNWPDYSVSTWGPKVYTYYGLDYDTPSASASLSTPSASAGGTGWQTEIAPASDSDYDWQSRDLRRYGPTRSNGTPIDNGTAPDGKGTFVRGVHNY